MKKLILSGLFGALAMLLLQGPLVARAMDAGIMDSGGYRGYEMGPGMMRYGGYPDDGSGPGFLGQCYGNEGQYRQNQSYLDRKGAERVFEDYLNSRHNPNLKLGEVKDEGSVFEADLLTKDNSLVDKLIVNKNTGQMRSAY